MHTAAVHPLSIPNHNDHSRYYQHPSPVTPPVNPQAGYRRSSAPNTTRRTSIPTTILNRNKSTKSLRDRRKSSSALSTCSTKPRRMIGDYYVGKTLGKGASGRVKLGVHRITGEEVAIKIISKAHLAQNPAIEKAVRREIAIMKLINHPNVMSLIDVIDDDNSPDLHLILEYVEGGELFEYLVSKGRLSEKEARKHFQRIIFGLDYCHRHLICHRDLKPENLLLDKHNNIKIADFGMASLQPAGSLLETSCGSPHYASPEIVAGLPYNGSASDIWSCGVILFALLTGHLPFDDDNIRQLLKKVKAGKYVMPDSISHNAQDLIRRILVVDADKRLTMDEIKQHPWFLESEPDTSNLPIPPSPSQIGRPVSDPSEIDDRILETIKFLWGESSDDAVVRALISKEHNMQKVVYVLLQQHAERYWQVDHDDDADMSDSDDYYDNRLRRYSTVNQRDRRCMSMTEHTRKPQQRPSVPWIPDKTVNRRYSAVSIRRQHYQQQQQDQPAPPLPLPVPSPPPETGMKKSQTFYERVRGVLTSRRQSKQQKDETHATKPASPQQHHQGTTLTGTLRRKNPFGKVKDPEIPTPPPKSSLRHSLLPRNSKVDPLNDRRSSTVNPKKLSIRVDDARKFAFTLSGHRRQQRKELDLAVFDVNNDSQLSPPPALSDGSTLSSSSSSSSSTHHEQHQHQQQQYRPGVKEAATPRRVSEASSIQSFDRRGSDIHPPSLLSNSSTITAATTVYSPSPVTPKTSWLSNLFFFKQPKICYLTVYDSEICQILKSLHSVMNKVAEVRFYEKTDKHGTRYKIEIKSKNQAGKTQQVKCRMDFILPSAEQTFTRVQFTQQQGDALLLMATIREAQVYLEQQQQQHQGSLVF